MFKGSYVALVTPFKQNMEVDFEAYGRLIDFHLEKGTDGIVPCGCTGEAATLSHDEQKRCIRFTVERVAGRVPVVAGTGSNNTAEAVGLTKYAAEAGADGALLITPYYNKPTAAGQIAHYRAVAAAVDIPIMLYNVPGRTGVKMEPATVAELSRTPNITSIKEACGSVDQVTQIISLCGITVLSGDDSLTLPFMAVGAQGVISVASNLYPKEVGKLVSLALAHDYQKARALHRRLYPVFKTLFIESNPAPVKLAMVEAGIIGSEEVRPPLCALSAASRKTLLASLAEFRKA